ncbi:MAG: type 1 glutamine amidotransferase [Deltaproteobacteria bacterium]|nr:type 1 glutamine amidotransferase [Deltaproteobacteria bacterium]MBI2500238.1 type 1 glutamine amidotransferase [Deltaproteobacteria bacterium]
MKKDNASLKLLLLQIRDDPRVRQEEHDSFSRFSGLAKSQIEILNVFDTPRFDPTIVDPYDAVLVGGASEASVLEREKYPFVPESEKLLLHCLEKEIPVFASCYGFQLAVTALGGRIVRDKKDFETGTIPIRLTLESKNDPLFCDMPNPFLAVSVHRERALSLPHGCELLALTDSCPHAFRVFGKPFWAMQFHPEVDRETLVRRLTIYKQHYTENDEQLAKVLSSAVPTPESNQLVRRFVERALNPP